MSQPQLGSNWAKGRVHGTSLAYAGLWVSTWGDPEQRLGLWVLSREAQPEGWRVCGLQRQGRALWAGVQAGAPQGPATRKVAAYGKEAQPIWAGVQAGAP